MVDNQRILEDNLKQLPTLAKANDRKSFAAAIDEINDSLTALSREIDLPINLSSNIGGLCQVVFKYIAPCTRGAMCSVYAV